MVLSAIKSAFPRILQRQDGSGVLDTDAKISLPNISATKLCSTYVRFGRFLLLRPS
ncbi:MAG: hypothetical protein PUJ79_06650 [Helicobacter sp.]|nr:hypothetical protein [Helicobacter sp.]MDD7568065.1 hypothetical protein [Helicobacter sp.]MDY5741263.1 hypothetical protein [Helicobacter sp.]